jgi:hypothetical protein
MSLQDLATDSGVSRRMFLTASAAVGGGVMLNFSIRLRAA